MPSQGWAGSQAPGAQVRCAICLRDNKLIYAETYVQGTAVCQHHVRWIALPLHPADPPYTDE